MLYSAFNERLKCSEKNVHPFSYRLQMKCDESKTETVVMKVKSEVK